MYIRARSEYNPPTLPHLAFAWLASPAFLVYRADSSIPSRRLVPRPRGALAERMAIDRGLTPEPGGTHRTFDLARVPRL